MSGDFTAPSASVSVDTTPKRTLTASSKSFRGLWRTCASSHPTGTTARTRPAPTPRSYFRGTIITEPYYDVLGTIWRLSPFEIKGYDPLEDDEDVSGAILEACKMLQWYARNHTLACVVPALFIAGATGR